jgi:hypothetical protein
MKTLFTILLIAICGFANAQTKKPFSYYSQETLNNIGATQEQKDKIAEIKKAAEIKIRAVGKNNELTDEQKKAEYKVHYGEAAKLYNAVLTPEQMIKLRENILKFNKENNK